jgi:hypothetical protein
MLLAISVLATWIQAQANGSPVMGDRTPIIFQAEGPGSYYSRLALGTCAIQNRRSEHF